MKFTPEEIAAIAKEAGITFWPMTVDGVVYDYRHVHCNDAKFKDEAGCIELLVALVAEKAAAKERESIAAHYDAQPHMEFFGRELADEIRARGQKEGAC